MQDFREQTNRFLAWFKDQGGTFRDDLIELKDLRAQGAGRGVVAIKDIPQDTILFTIPRESILSVETSDLVKRIPGVFDASNQDDDNQEPLDPWISLILVVMYEILGTDSKWAPYLDILPETFDTPIFWSETELKELEGTCLTMEKIGKQQSDEMLKSKLIPIIYANPSVFRLAPSIPYLPEDFLNLAHRIGSIIMAYAFDLEPDDDSSNGEDGWVEDKEGRGMLGMVPMADLLNANAAFNTHINHDEKLQATTLRKVIPAETEILNYYGPLPSSELLRRYGYTTPEHYRYDVAEIAWEEIKESLAKHLSLPATALAKADEQFEDGELEEWLTIERDSRAPDEQGQLTHVPQVTEISSELEEQFKAYLKAIKKVVPDLANDKRKRDEIYQAIIGEVIRDKLLAYPTTFAEDEALLARADITKRHRMAIEVRQGEKRLLQEALDFLSPKAAGQTMIKPDEDPLLHNAKKARKN